MDLQLSGKTAVVTGGSKGIGKACARLLAEEGVDVAILARNQQTLDATAAEIAAATSRRVLAIACDTGDTASVNAAFEQAAKARGRLDILVNCAAQPGGAPPRPGIEHLPDENFVEQMNVKVLGYARCARAAVPYMKANGWGRIINISGLAARQTGNAIGSMRNVAVSALTKNLADELGPFGINVTCVHPGLIWTEFMEQQMQRQAEQRGETLEQAKERMAQGNTVQRIIQAEDIASVVAFLASPLSIAITGDSIAAGGGVGRAIHY
ncbi:MAG: SDR family oxidoreductase [Dehalococcoidia bacterium]|jgi:NAD(P)-dependent dehydrogenase (short-subunit alcohol dehydrogenase family)